MARLIDADDLLEQYSLKDATKYGNKDSEKQAHSYSTMMLYEIADMIEGAPTAYDVDEVAEQLKGLHEGYKCTDNEFQRGAKAGAHYVLNRAIEIVKGGGVNE